MNNQGRKQMFSGFVEMNLLGNYSLRRQSNKHYILEL